MGRIEHRLTAARTSRWLDGVAAGCVDQADYQSRKKSMAGAGAVNKDTQLENKARELSKKPNNSDYVEYKEDFKSRAANPDALSPIKGALSQVGLRGSH